MNNTFVALTGQDLQLLVTQITKENKKMFTYENRPEETRDTSWDLKFAEQTAFTGKPEKLDPMIQEAEVHFAVQDKIYNTPNKKVYYILSLFKTGNTKLWKEQYLQQCEGKTLCKGDLWKTFKETLNKSFCNIESKDDAMTQLQQIWQAKGQTVDEYNTWFRILILKAGLDEQENTVILIQLYSKGLNKDIGTKIIINEPPAILSGWMRKASILDRYTRRA